MDIAAGTVEAALVRVSEVFYSLQGEARTVGWPTVFIRLSGCPLRCRYCDTTYAYTGGEVRSVDQLMTAVAAYRPRHVTVTGGEPLAQRGCLSLLTALCDSGYEVSLETSGALDVAGVDPRVVKVMDLKTPDSGESHRNRYENLAYLGLQDQVKFVIGSRHDYEWACHIIREFALSERCEVLLSPVHGVIDPRDLAQWMLDDRVAARFQIQLHKVLWGDTPGR